MGIYSACSTRRSLRRILDFLVLLSTIAAPAWARADVKSADAVTGAGIGDGASASTDRHYVLSEEIGRIEPARADSCGAPARAQLAVWIRMLPVVTVTADGVGYDVRHVTNHPTPYLADVTAQDAGAVYGHWFRGKFHARHQRLVIVVRAAGPQEPHRIEVNLIGDAPSPYADLADVCELFGLGRCIAMAYGSPVCHDRWVTDTDGADSAATR